MPLILNLLTFLGPRTWWSRAISSATASADAEKCLGNIARLVNAGGYLFVSGVDLDVRTKIAFDLGWEPVRELMAEIYNSEPSVRADWPWQRSGLEPLSRRQRDWQTRYTAVFRIASPQRQRFRVECNGANKSKDSV